MIERRMMKGPTHLRRVLESLDPTLGRDDVKKIARALKADDAFATVTVYHDGWVPRSYRFAAVGTRTTVRIEGCGFTVTKSNYDRRRPNGVGPTATCHAGRADQSQGRRVWSF